MQTTDPLDYSDARSKEGIEPLYRVLIHNDDATPYHYVIAVLMVTFNLSHELGEHVTHVAHTKGTARVIIRPRKDAEMLVHRAHAAAKTDGYPLTFSLEPDE